MKNISGARFSIKSTTLSDLDYERVVDKMVGWGIRRAVACEILEEVGMEIVNKEGKFVKRLRKALHRAGIKVDNSQFGELSFIVTPTEYIVSVEPPPFDWEAGDFGDSGSCFWGSRRHDKRFLEKSRRCLAVKVYYGNGTNCGSGYGRCWMWVYGDRYFLFNAYSQDGWLDLETIAQWLVDHLLEDYTWVEAQASGQVYINGHRAIVLYKKGEPPWYEVDIGDGGCDDFEDDFEDDFDDYNDDIMFCDGCGRPIDGEYIQHEGHLLCARCAKGYTPCFRCGNIIRIDDGFPLLTTDQIGNPTTRRICHSCRVHYVRCYNCCTFVDWRCRIIIPLTRTEVVLCRNCYIRRR